MGETRIDDASIGAAAKADDTTNVEGAVTSGAGEAKEATAAEAAAGSEPSADADAALSADGSAANGSASDTWFPPPPAAPTQLDASGLRFDFNDGCRVFMPDSDHPWRVRHFRRRR